MSNYAVVYLDPDQDNNPDPAEPGLEIDYLM
jgi:hypothetical protein